MWCNVGQWCRKTKTNKRRGRETHREKQVSKRRGRETCDCRHYQAVCSLVSDTCSPSERFGLLGDSQATATKEPAQDQTVLLTRKQIFQQRLSFCWGKTTHPRLREYNNIFSKKLSAKLNPSALILWIHRVKLSQNERFRPRTFFWSHPVVTI